MAASLNYRHIFGFKANVKDSVHYADENVVMYPAGHNVVKYYTENKLQEFINGTDVSKGITSITVGAEKRYIAVAERSSRGIVFVYNLRTLYKRKQLSTPEVTSSEYVSMCFSSDNSLLLTQGGAPDWTLVCWAWEKSKVLALVKTAPMSPPSEVMIHKVSFNPIDPRYVCVTGRNILRFYRIDEDKFTPITESPAMARREPTNYMCHTWLAGNRTVVGTTSGELLLFHETELLAVLPSSPLGGNSIDCLTTFSRGFLAAGGMGILRMYEPTEDAHQYYVQTREFPVRVAAGAAPPTIRSMALSPSEDTVTVALDNCQLMQLSLAHVDFLKDDIAFKHLGTPSHGPKPRTVVLPSDTKLDAGITGMDVCIRKPLVVTCGADNSVRVWNYLDKTLEQLRYFPSEESHSVAFHPSGLHILVGFSDKLRLMNLLMDDIRPFKEFNIKGCRECRFANGGHCFAAVNNTMIQVFNTYTCDLISTLRGHNSKVLSLCWTPNDYTLVSAGQDGAVYQWDLYDSKREGKREGEYVSKGVAYTSVVANAKCTAVFAVGSDHALKEIEFPLAQVAKELDAKVVLGQVILSNSQHMLFAGVAEHNPSCAEPGAVRSYKFPLSGDSFEYPAVSDAVTRMRISNDDAYLFVAGADGALCVFEVREKDGRLPHRDRETQVPWAEEILVTKTELEEKEAQMSELQNKVDELQVNNDYALRMKDIAYNEKIKKVTEKYASDLEQNKNQYDLLREEKTDLEREYEERLSAMEVSHRAEMQKRESLYQSKIMEEVERYQQLQHETEQQKQRWEEKQMDLLGSHEAYIKAITDDFEAQLEEVRTQRMDMEEEKEGTMRDWKETKRQMEEDVDTEVMQLKKRYEDKLQAEREATMKFKGENGIMKKKFTALHKDIEEQREEIKAMVEKEKQLKTHMNSLDREIVSLRELIHERDVTIGEKEKKIYELKKRNQELEKFKFVLDYKIKGLKRQIEPREREIADMRRQINDVDTELEKFHNSNAGLDLLIGSLRQQLDDMQQTIMRHRVRLGSQRSLLSSFQSELHEVVQSIQNPQELREGVSELYKRHVKESLGKEEADVAIAKEYTRQKEYLERSIEALKKKLQSDSLKHRQDNLKVMQDNMSLIKEINELRKEHKNMKMAVADANQTGTRPGGTRRRTPRSSSAKLRASRGSDAPPMNGGANGQALIDANREEIGALKAEIRRLEEAMVASRPVSRERPSHV